MTQVPSFKYFYCSDSKILDVILPGISEGMDSEFILKILYRSRFKKNSVVTFNYPFFERDEKQSSGEELYEEVRALENILDFISANSFETIRLIGKSLGAIIAAKFLSKLSKSEQNKFSLIVLGYIIGDINLKDVESDITIIQGSRDRFCKINEVKKELKRIGKVSYKIYEIEGASHGFRDKENEKIEYYDDVILKIF